MILSESNDLTPIPIKYPTKSMGWLFGQESLPNYSKEKKFFFSSKADYSAKSAVTNRKFWGNLVCQF